MTAPDPLDVIDLDAMNAGNPYVGPRSIAYGESIFGRDREISELLDTIISNRVVLLYSPSGAGKSSLLEAGLRPGLEAWGFDVLPTVRVGQDLDGALGNRYVESTIAALEAVAPDDLVAADHGEFTLDRYLRHLAESSVDQDRDLCVIFDQFEEVFTLDPTDREAKLEFLTQLSVAARDRSRWLIVSMREDFIAQLDPYLALFPTRLNTRYRLDLMAAGAAKEAIRRPALAAGVDFTEEAADRLVSDLRQVRVTRGDEVTTELGPHVEPVQLQVVCRRLWRRLDL